jgi:hypothetical protein
MVEKVLERMTSLIPKPVSVTPSTGVFTFTESTKILIEPATQELTFIGQYLADKLKSSTGFELPVVSDAGEKEPEILSLHYRYGFIFGR